MDFAPITGWCQCENLCHCHDESPDKPGHEYGATFDVEDLTEVRTIFGRFVVCVDCARTCLADPDLLATPEGRP